MSTILALLNPFQYLRSSWALTRNLLIIMYIRVSILFGLEDNEGSKGYQPIRTVQFSALLFDRRDSWEPGLNSAEVSPLLNRRSFVYETFLEDSKDGCEHVSIQMDSNEKIRKGTLLKATANTWIELLHEIFGSRYTRLKSHPREIYMEKRGSRSLFQPGLGRNSIHVSVVPLPPPTRVFSSNPNLLMT
ncbi:hypothetical protein K7432_009961 [Basidiobolus ranarum]|uniref:Uncharacterized protein n=1 Tax=Basidiobolus ranarum TaxID=34480 RepID=A0ABR2WPH3_9FUNG